MASRVVTSTSPMSSGMILPNQQSEQAVISLGRRCRNSNSTSHPILDDRIQCGNTVRFGRSVRPAMRRLISSRTSATAP
ncbi:hypothetical protein GDI3754 [Gluconacetobacter diazotrophicus PA1 5]|uniref:Uncharacterized protein n=1 Tax=Gluconacetobacter diazotrophicus (strain ATCC 49037 / DSM 5601 / CCUG 37298 / CIP 103539 / LMG 7603 / PAl5) TaxID=272568 RepID=A9H9E5_GLUDA|nr:hypothetical protein GDI3754 [Gluconacetobacter diazotrophicus PA1 5]